jgi:DNA polymerase zeta
MATSNIENSVFSCRVFHCDYYLTKPLDKYDVAFSEFQGKPSKYCPVIRLFGSLQNGEKCCVHIHGVFPYLLICSHGPKTAITRQYLRHLTKSIDLALRVSFGAPRDTCYVFKITVVEAISMYGYHDTNQVFLKIFLYNPLLIKRLAELLLSGAILNRVMQPYEAHVPYILQV